MYKVAFVGDFESVAFYSFTGAQVFVTDSIKKCTDTVDTLAKSNYAVIFVTENLFSQIESTVEKYENEKLPAVIPIPSVSGNSGVGISKVYASVIKAVGADILNDEKR